MGRRLSSVVLAVVLGAVACSSGSGTPATGGGSGSCESVCSRAESLHCANYPAGQCETECQTELGPQISACPSESSAYFGCIQQLPMQCDADGEPTFVNEDAVTTQCGAQALALSGCAACLPESGDDTCETCIKQSCCSERKALYGDPATLQLYNCVQGCAGDSACQQACASQYPGLEAKAVALNTCEQSKCGC